MILQLQHQTGGSVRKICNVLQLPRSSFYHAAKPSSRLEEDARLGELIKELFTRNRRRYGYRRIHEELRDHDIVCAPSRLRRILKEQGLKAIQPKNYLPKTSDGRADQPSANLLAQQPLPQKPGQAWVSDITFIPTSANWLYLAVVMDLGSRRIVGWSLATHMRSELVVHALEQALQTHPKASGVIFHSDRGSQYGSIALRCVLTREGLRQSMSGRANPYDNAWTESFMGTLKREMLQGGRFEDLTDARLELFEYIEGYYNNQRKHSALGYLTPNEFETQSRNLN